MENEEQDLEEELTFSPSDAWSEASDETIEEAMEFSDKYQEFISKAKTEREALKSILNKVEKYGFKSIEDVDELESGDKVYIVNREKSVALAVIGEKDITEGCQILSSHIDAPRLDLKVNPLYEDGESSLGLFKTHYYGGIKKYQWVNVPLALHGRIVKEDGDCIDITIGEDEDDPVFVVSDLLPHLSKKKQSKRKMKDVIKGEELNVIIGGIPIEDEDVDKKIKINILNTLKEKYDISEEDLVSAELEIVPSGDAKDIGLDRSMIGGYGQDDRICAFMSMMASIDVDSPSKTSISIMFDKEEIGSEGNTGANSRFLESVFSQILDRMKENYTMEDHRKVMENSKAISGDVDPGVNPSFKGVHDMQNAAKIGKGLVLTKFTGAGGKYGANDAHAEYVAYIRSIMNENDVPWQIAELGKVDEGGGGTVAKFISNLNIDVIDAGPPVLGMHSPFEITSKIDLYQGYRGYRAFLEAE